MRRVVDLTAPSVDSWMSELLGRYPKLDPWGRYPFLDAAAPIAFEHLFIPFVIAAGDQLRWQSQDLDTVLEEQAFCDLQRHLLERMSQLASKTCMLELTAVKAVRSPQGWLSDFADSPNAISTDSYRKLIERWYADPGGSLFAEYPELLRLLAVYTQDWIRNHAAFIERLTNDWNEIHEQLLDSGPTPQRVRRIESMSDPHRRGQVVLALAFAHGGQVVYKPKNLGPDRAFGQLLNWLNEQSAPVRLIAVPVLTRADYGWTAFIRHAPCRNEQEVEQYYRRSGALLSVFYLLAGSDFHYENIIASGSYPVAIDLETMLTPCFADPDKPGTATYRAKQMLNESVIHTLFLPAHMKIAGRTFNRGGLGDVADLSVHEEVWQNINTDGMCLVMTRQENPMADHLPEWNGRLVGLDEQIACLLEGFECMYRFIMHYKQAFLGPEGPLTAFQGIPVRTLRRNTSVYGQLLENAAHPTNLKSPGAYWERVRQRLLSQADASLEAMIDDEILQMQGGDIPYFFILSDQLAFYGSDAAPLPNPLQQASYDRLRAKISRFDETDLRLQVSLIQMSLEGWLTCKADPYRKNVTNRTLPSNMESGRTALSWQDAGLPREQDLLRHAIEIADRLEMLAIEGEDGSLTWVDLVYEEDCFSIKTLSLGLYEGQVGVALFFAGMYRVTETAKYRRLAERCLLELEQASRPDRRSRREWNVAHHMAGGSASLVYGLTVIAGLLEDVRWLALATRLSNDLDPERWMQANITLPDVLLGKPGMILSLLKLFEQTGDRKLVNWARIYGEDLLADRLGQEGRYEDWYVRRYDHRWTGFSHGAAGIAWTLLRLHQVTKEARWLASAGEAIRYEQAQFIEERQLWPDYRVEPPDQGLHDAWCHGSIGIGLARLAGLPQMADYAVMQEVEVAIRNAVEASTARTDHVCCGNLGRVELLLAAGRARNDHALRDAALRIAADVMQARQKLGHYRLDRHANGNVGFFQGLSGIGYTWLRMLAPDRVPSILLFD